MKSVTEQHPGLSPEGRASLDFVLRAAALLFRQRRAEHSSTEFDPQLWESGRDAGASRKEKNQEQIRRE